MGATRSWQQLAEEVVSTNMQRSRYRDASVGLSVMNWVSLGTERAEDGWMDTPTCFPDQQVEGGGVSSSIPRWSWATSLPTPSCPSPQEMPEGCWDSLASQLQGARDALQGFALLNFGR